MGGLVIFVAVAVPFLILSDYRAVSLGRVRHGAWPAARSGFADDWTKITQEALARDLGRGTSCSSRPRSRSACGWWPPSTSGSTDTLRLRIVDASIDLGLLYPVLIFLVLAGATNGVNLTDGLDGLAAGCAAIVLLAYTGDDVHHHRPGGPGAARARAWSGACVGLPVVQLVPGAIFMGDTGSLGLGGAIAALAVMTKTEVLLLI